MMPPDEQVAFDTAVQQAWALMLMEDRSTGPGNPYVDEETSQARRQVIARLGGPEVERLLRRMIVDMSNTAARNRLVTQDLIEGVAIYAFLLGARAQEIHTNRNLDNPPIPEA